VKQEARPGQTSEAEVQAKVKDMHLLNLNLTKHAAPLEDRPGFSKLDYDDPG
jgi:hypothetical protein